MRYTITCRSSFNAELERQSLIAGLHAPNAAISPKYFYDELGCLLYLAICRLPEYYLTRTEASIFTHNGEAIADYSDPLGVTAAFNLSMLNHVNRLIGSDFDLKNFCHVGFYNESIGRVEMQAGFATIQCWQDDSRDFCVFHAS